MKAAIFYGPRDIRTEEVKKPDIQDNEVLIHVKSCGICGSDLHLYKLGLYSDSLTKPTSKGGIPGHEISGDIIKVGTKVQGLEEGDRVAAVNIMGGMADYVSVPVVPGFTVLNLPQKISYEEAATLDPICNSLHSISKGNPSKGENIVIFGVGAIGLGIIQCFKSLNMDLKKIIAVDISDYRLKVAKQFGADNIINAAVDDPNEKILEYVDSIPWMLSPSITFPAVDKVFDCVGYMKDHPGLSVFQQAMNMVRPITGKIIVTGLFEENVSLDLSPLVFKQVNVIGSFGFTPMDIKQGLELMQFKKINRLNLISHEFSLNQAKEAFEMASNINESLKVLIKP